MKKFFEQQLNASVSRRTLLQGGAGLIGGVMLPGGLIMPAFADDKPAIGTWPAGSSGSIGVHRRCGAAHRHLRRAGRGRTQGLSARGRAHQHGHELIKKISPKTKQGRARQGSEVRRRRFRAPSRTRRCRRSSASSPRTRRCMITGGTSSAVAVALNKLAQREKVLFVVRHLRLERHHRQGLRALRLPPELLRPDRGGGDRARCWSSSSARTRKSPT